MTHLFDSAVVTAVLGHMNDDHTGDNLLIVRAFGGASDAVSAEMTGFDGDGGDWKAVGADGAVTTARVAWPGGAITERPEVRREIVALYDAACAHLGVPARPHA